MPGLPQSGEHEPAFSQPRRQFYAWCEKQFVLGRDSWQGWAVLKGVISAKMVKIIKFLFFAQKVSSGMGGIASQIFRGLAALEPPQNGGQKGGQRGRGSFFSVFDRKRKRKWKKYFVHFVGNLSRIPKLFFFSF